MKVCPESSFGESIFEKDY